MGFDTAPVPLKATNTFQSSEYHRNPRKRHLTSVCSWDLFLNENPAKMRNPSLNQGTIMQSQEISEYNRDQLAAFRALACAVECLTSVEREALRGTWQPYLEFRKELTEYFAVHFAPFCRETCFNTGMSACCGYESIFTFFADHVINFLESEAGERDALFQVLGRPNKTDRCVYLGERGCLWRVTPISCAMFFCEQAKGTVFGENPDAEAIWLDLKEKEKAFTRPTKPVIFDEIEAFFLARGLDSPFMYFHKSPGLMRLKAKSGLTSRLP
jgi:hypothetical protein